MSVLRGFVIIIGAGLLGAVVGGVGGFLVGTYAPGYFRSQFPGQAMQPWFNPVEVGTVLALWQGAVVGLIVGSVVVLAVSWQNSSHKPLDVSLPIPEIAPEARVEGEGITEARR